MLPLEITVEARYPNDTGPSEPSEEECDVMPGDKVEPKVDHLPDPKVDEDEVIKPQLEDSSLKEGWNKAKRYGQPDDELAGLHTHGELLLRKWRPLRIPIPDH